MKKLKILGFSSLSLISLTVLTSCDNELIKERISTTVSNMFPNLYLTLMQLGLFILTALIFFFFAYKPLKKKINERAEHIKNNIDESEKKNQDAENKLKEANKIVSDSQIKAAEIIQEAEVTAETKAINSEKELVKELEKKKALAHKDIENERNQMLKEAKTQIINAAIDTSKEILKREITAEDNDRMVEEFVDELSKN